MAPNDHLRAGAVLLNAITELTVDVEEQFRDSGNATMQKRAQSLQAHVAQFAASVNTEIDQMNGSGE